MGNIYSSYIFEDNDEVKVLALAFGEQEKKVFDVSSSNPFLVRNELKKLKNALKQDYDLEGYQIYIKTEKMDKWIPVDHFYWKDGDYKVGVEFTSYCCYVKKSGFGQDFNNKIPAINRLANLIWKN
jgi:hypothetical protein